MKWVRCEKEMPRDQVDVHVKTANKRGVARYWSSLDKWLSATKDFDSDDIVIKWKYADAIESPAEGAA